MLVINLSCLSRILLLVESRAVYSVFITLLRQWVGQVNLHLKVRKKTKYIFIRYEGLELISICFFRKCVNEAKYFHQKIALNISVVIMHWDLRSFIGRYFSLFHCTLPLKCRGCYLRCCSNVSFLRKICCYFGLLVMIQRFCFGLIGCRLVIFDQSVIYALCK